jgi:hypothetical protein
LIDAAGRKVLSVTSKNKLKSIDVSHLNSGLYILSVFDGESRSAYHIIKE